MNRLILLLLLCLSSKTILAQDQEEVHKFWIYDTSKVVCFYASGKDIPDTIAYLKDKTFDGSHYIIYWDKSFQHKYQELFQGGKNNYITYYRNGQLNEETLYRDSLGNKFPNDDFRWRAFYPNGNKKGEQIFEGKKRTTIFYYQNGQIKKRDVSILGLNKRFPTHYEYVYNENFCSDGSLISKDSIGTNTIRTMTIYHCNHKKKIEFLWNGVNVIGKWQEWYENGQLKTDGQYNETLPKDSLLYSISKMQGQWKYYNEKGELEKTETYYNDKLIATKETKPKPKRR